jgi:hypothetical protein
MWLDEKVRRRSRGEVQPSLRPDNDDEDIAHRDKCSRASRSSNGGWLPVAKEMSVPPNLGYGVADAKVRH